MTTQIRNGDDFKSIITFIDGNGAQPSNVGEMHFKLIYRDRFQNEYIASFDGANRVNHVLGENNTVVVIFENYNFQRGQLTRDSYFRINDSDFSDDDWEIGNHETTSIVLI